MKTKYLLLFMLFYFSIAPFVHAAATVGKVGSLQSSDHTKNTSSNDTVITVTWTAASVSSDSSLNGYATAWDHSSSTNPVTKTLSSSATTVDSPSLSDASDWYFHIRAIADDGTYGQTSHLGPFVINTKPGITSISPATGTTTSTTDITITGTNFLSNATVNIGSTSATNIQVKSQTKITATVPSAMGAGTYTVKVTNPDLQIATKTGAFTVSVQNTAPVAKAGQDQTINDVNIQVTLDGSSSSDGDGDTLTYAWSQSGGTSVSLSSSTASNPTFTPTQAGTYTFQLIVNDGTENSNPDTVDIIVNSSANSVPIAVITVTQGISVAPNTQLDLSGSGSSAGDTGQTLTYAWSIVTAPTGSVATLSASNTVSVTFTPVIFGTYKIKLTVTDSYAQPLSDDTTIIITANTPPTADAGQDQTVNVGTSVNLIGTGDAKDTGQSITAYSWSFTNKPANSSATLTTADAATTGFIPDSAGTYTLKFTVNDGIEIISDTVDVTAQSTTGGSSSTGSSSTGSSNVSDNATVSTDATNTGNVSNIIVDKDVSITNTGGTITNVTLSSNATIDGGTISGTVTGDTGVSITNAVIDITSISNVNIGSGCKVTCGTVANVSGLNLTGAITAMGGLFVDSDAPLLVDSTGKEHTAGNLIIDSINTILADTSTNILTTTDGVITIFAQNLGDVVVPGKIQSVVTTSETDGVTLTASGELVITKSGIAITLAPMPADQEAFENGLKSLGVTGNIQGNGLVIAELSGGEKMALRFNNVAQSTVSTASLSSTSAGFIFVGDSNNLEGYCILATYPDGTSQILPPFVHDLDQFKTAMGNLGLDYKIIPSTGVIEILDSTGKVSWRGIPDYTIVDVFLVTTGISFKDAGDLNGDGLSDLYMITGAGKQAIYTLP